MRLRCAPSLLALTAAIILAPLAAGCPKPPSDGTTKPSPEAIEPAEQGDVASQGGFGQQTWLMDYPDPDNILWVLLDSDNAGAPGNWSRYSNPKFDELVRSAKTLSDPVARQAAYEEAEALAHADAPWLLLFNRKCQILKQSYVQGLNITTLDRAPVLPGVDLEPVSFSGGGPEDGIYRFPINTPIPTLDPALVTDTVSSSVVNQLFDGLVKIAPDGTLVENLALNYAPDPAGLVYTFNLRPGVKFHNGREMTADDVVYSFTRILTPATASPKQLFLDPLKGSAAFKEGKADHVEGVTATGTHTVVLTLETPNALFPWYLAQSTCAIVPKEAVEGSGPDWPNTPVGTGPFKMGPDTYNFNEGLTVVRNDDYFAGPAKLAGVKYIVEREDKKRFEGFKAGLYEHADIPPTEVDGVMADPALKAMIAERPTFDLYHIAFNTQKPPFKDNAKLRQAFNYAIDKEYIADTILKGTRVVCDSFMPVGFPNFTPKHEGYKYNVDEARRLLSEAGYPDGKGLPTLRLWYSTDETHARIMESVQSDLSKIGVTVELKTLEWASFLETMDSGEY